MRRCATPRVSFALLTDQRLKFEIAENLGMHIGEIRDEIQDADGNTLGYLVRQGIDGLHAKELRFWRQLFLRRMNEAEKRNQGQQ